MISGTDQTLVVPPSDLRPANLVGRRRMLGLLGGSAMAAGAVLIAGDMLIGEQQAEAATCSAGVTPRDLGGGNFFDRNYVIEVPLKKLPQKYRILYKGKVMNLNFHGIFNNRLRWGVSTGWAYVNSGWTNSGNWSFTYDC